MYSQQGCPACKQLAGLIWLLVDPLIANMTQSSHYTENTEMTSVYELRTCIVPLSRPLQLNRCVQGAEDKHHFQFDKNCSHGLSFTFWTNTHVAMSHIVYYIAMEFSTRKLLSQHSLSTVNVGIVVCVRTNLGLFLLTQISACNLRMWVQMGCLVWVLIKMCHTIGLMIMY